MIAILSASRDAADSGRSVRLRAVGMGLHQYYGGAARGPSTLTGFVILVGRRDLGGRASRKPRW